jgi:hypothetical protein
MSANAPDRAQLNSKRSKKRSREAASVLNTNIFEDSELSELESDAVEVPTESQHTNNDSTEVLPDPEPAFQSPFDYSWVRFDDGELRGIRRPASLIKMRAWWWKYGAPLESYPHDQHGKHFKHLYFLCKTRYLSRQRRTGRLNITNGHQGVLNHFKSIHNSTYLTEGYFTREAQTSSLV